MQRNGRGRSEPLLFICVGSPRIRSAARCSLKKTGVYAGGGENAVPCQGHESLALNEAGQKVELPSSGLFGQALARERAQEGGGGSWQHGLSGPSLF